MVVCGVMYGGVFEIQVKGVVDVGLGFDFEFLCFTAFINIASYRKQY